MENVLKTDLIVRKTEQQRILTNQNISANGSISTVINVGIGTKALHLVCKANANMAIGVYPCDKDGNPLTYTAIASTSSVPAITNSIIINELGGAPFIAVFVFDKSSNPNTCQFVDVFYTKQ